MKKKCKICDDFGDVNIYYVKEMMFGFKDEFEYFECLNCGCLQLAKIPEDLSKYYSEDYYSFIRRKDGKIKKLLKKHRGLTALNISHSFIGQLSNKIFDEPDYSFWLKSAKIKLNSKILDIGCGNGNLLFELLNVGFNNLFGLDAFIDKSVMNYDGLKIIKGSIDQLNDKYDLILLNHSFEHFPDQLPSLNNIKHLLNENGKLIIRIPIKAYAWEKYNVCWASLDAPRHSFLHTVKSFKILANNAGFKIINIKFDSTDFQFWASEQYQQNVPLLSESSYRINPANSAYRKTKINKFKEKATDLNRSEEGDQAGFILVHST